jgi:phage tail-like protein
MADDKEHIKSTYPLPVYNYRVTIQSQGASLAVSFAEVSGLNIEYEPVTYKHGLSFAMGSKIIPGMRQPTRLVMKRGIVKTGSYLYRWLHKAYNDPSSMDVKRDILIELRDEEGKAVVNWTAERALPIKLETSAFDANSNDVAIETMEVIVHNLRVEYR